MTNSLAKAAILMAAAAISTPASAMSVPADAAQRLDSLFCARYPDASAPGAAVLVAWGDSVIYERYFGIADMQSRQPVGPDTRFNIASVSKQMTVVGLLQLDVDLNTPASQFFDYPQPFWHKVTLEHLAAHSSGIPDSRDRSDRNVCVMADENVSVSYFPNVSDVQFEPGTDYDYLNPSFILLANIIERMSGLEFTEFQQRNIFDPLGMSSTYYFDRNIDRPATAHGYVPDGKGGWKEYDFGEETFFATRPDGGVYSTARDMLRWEQGLASGSILNPAKLADAYSPHTLVSGSRWCDYQNRPYTWYGLGWFIERTPRRPVKVYHTGDNGGFQAYVAKYPETGLRIIVLENRNDRDRWQMAQAIDNIFFNPN